MKKTTIILTALLLASCANTETRPRPVPHYVYQQYPVSQLNVGSIQVVNSYVMPMNAPNAEHLMPQPLPKAVEEWAHNHFKATGGDGTLTITIKDASVVEQDLKRTKGVKGVVTIDQAERYDAKISVEFSVSATSSGKDGSGSVGLTRGQTIAEDASLEDRDVLWTGMEEKMLTDLDAGTQSMLQQKLGFLLQK